MVATDGGTTENDNCGLKYTNQPCFLLDSSVRLLVLLPLTIRIRRDKLTKTLIKLEPFKDLCRVLIRRHKCRLLIHMIIAYI